MAKPGYKHIESRCLSSSAKALTFSLIGTAVYLYLNLFSKLTVPFLLGGDQVSFWLRGLRMLDHQLVYRDFYQFTPPGADLVYFGLFRLFGPYVWVTNAFVLALGVLLSGVCFSIAARIMNRDLAGFMTAVFLVCIYTKLLNGTHHWLSILCVMTAVRLWINRGSRKNILAIGALLGCASFFTQTRGFAALAAFVVFFLWRRIKVKGRGTDVTADVGLLIAGFVAAWLVLNAYFIQAAGFKKLWYFQVAHVQSHIVGAVGGHLLGLPADLTLRNLPRLSPMLLVYVLLVLIYPLCLWRAWRDRQLPQNEWEPAALLVLVGLFLMAEVAFSPNWLRLYTVSMPAFVLLGWIVGRTERSPRQLLAICWLVLIGIACWQTASRYPSQPVIARLPEGAVAASKADAMRLLWLADRTRPGDFIFQAAWPGVYLPLGLRNPSYLETVVPFDGPPPLAVKNVPGELESKRVKFVIWSPSLNVSSATADDYLPPLRDYLHACYVPVFVFSGGDEAWQRKGQGSCQQHP